MIKLFITSLLFLTTACTSDRYHIIHKPLTIPSQCNFEKFTEEEKQTMIESVGRKIHRNQENCRIRQERIDALIKAHNEAHKN